MNLPDALKAIKEAAQYEYGIGSEDQRNVMRQARIAKGENPEGPKLTQMLGAYRTPQVIKAALFNKQDPKFKKAREETNIPIRTNTRSERIGSVLGALGADLTQDSARRFYWLLNAPQAVAEIVTEQSIGKFSPDVYKKGRVPAGFIQSLSIPTGAAVNASLGLLTPFGGAEGYKAVLPSAEDPTKSENVLAEVAIKYFMGRTGDLLPYDEFVKVRPDVSKDEYQRYKAFKFDKRFDADPRDGTVGLPMGLLKATAEGIHGPEVQFLGRSIPLTTGAIPYASALAGTVAGARSKRPIKYGFLGGLGGLSAGQIVGNLVENERRRRNTVENELGTL